MQQVESAPAVRRLSSYTFMVRSTQIVGCVSWRLVAAQKFHAICITLFLKSDSTRYLVPTDHVPNWQPRIFLGTHIYMVEA